MVIYNEKELDSIAFELKNFKVSIFLTDTIFGILSINKRKIYKIKKRPFYKKIILFIPNGKYIKNLTSNERQFIDKIWPGPITIVKSGISYRIPDDEFILSLLLKTGPLYCSSANLHKMNPIESIEEAMLVFKKSNNNIIYVERNFDVAIKKLPSTIYDIDKHVILREGSVSLDMISESFNN